MKNFKSLLFASILIAVMFFKPCTVLSLWQFAPYPIIFIHGLDSDDKTWDVSLNSFPYTLQKIFGNYADNSYSTPNNVFNAMLNRYPSMTRLEGPDGILGTNDDDVLLQTTPLIDGSLYTINFNTALTTSTPPSFILYQDQYALGSGESQSNEASIVKQGYALSKCIKEVLRVTGAAKVILVGHSMGGLCAREYLQRRVNGVPRWWVDPNSPDGHKVAKLITIGTPHWGCNFLNFMPKVKQNQDGNLLNHGGTKIAVANTSSEAVRDLRYSYLTGSQTNGVYLFGGYESGLNSLPSWMGGWHNRDVNCNGNETDYVSGIDTELSNTMPLPTNVLYTWITSNTGGTDDGVVETDRQCIMSVNGLPYPVGLTDTLLVHDAHTDEPSDLAAIIRGLDEPNQLSWAYEIRFNRTIRGTITRQTNNNPNDTDFFKVIIPPNQIVKGKFIVSLYDSLHAVNGNVRNLGFRLMNGVGATLKDTITTLKNPRTVLELDSSIVARANGTIYIRIIGSAYPDHWDSPYVITTTYQETGLVLTYPNGGETLYANSPATITWTSNGVSIPKVNLEYSANHGTSWTTIATAVTNTGAYTWTVPLALSPYCLVRISSSGNISVNDASNSPFTIAMPWKWAVSGGGSSYDFGHGIAVDGNGNSYITGSYSGTATFGTTTLISSGSTDVFIAKVNSNGVWLWAVRGGGAAGDVGYGIAVDGNGNSYITGYFSGTATFGTTTLISSGSTDVFVAKVNSNGIFLWAVRGGGSSYDHGNGIAVDGNGNSYITGYFSGTATFGTLTLISSGLSDVFVAKVNSNGVWQWAVRGGGTSENYGNGIAVDGNGNSYVIGKYSGTTNFGTSTLVSRGGYDVFVAKVNSGGVWQWAVRGGGTSDDHGNGIAVDGNGNSYITGYFSGTATFGTLTLISSGLSDVFVAKVNSNGVWQWAVRGGGTSENYGNGIAVDGNGNSYVIGKYSGTTNFGTSTLVSRGGYDVFITKMDGNGVMQWLASGGGTDFDYGNSIAVDGNKNCYITGYYSDTASFGSKTLTSNGSYDVFVGKILDIPLVLTLATPNGGETYYTGTPAIITWTTTGGNIPQVNLEYSTNNGTTWTAIATSITNIGSYSWTVPFTPSNQCLVRVSNSSNTSINDLSDAVFTIKAQSFTLISPNGGETYYTGSIATLSWTTAGGNIPQVNLEYSSNNGLTWTAIATGITNIGAYSWTVPFTPSNQCLVRVSNTANTAINDISDAVFTIKAQSFTLISPNGGENYIIGTTATITWTTAGGNIPQVNLEYSANNGLTWSAIATTLNNTGSYSWKVPFPPSNLCLMRVANTGNVAINDVSDAVFTIKNDPLGVGELPQNLTGLQIQSISPNPCVDFANVVYEIGEPSNLSCKIVDILGREIAVLFEGFQSQGIHIAHIDATKITSGLYYIQLKQGNELRIMPISILK